MQAPHRFEGRLGAAEVAPPRMGHQSPSEAATTEAASPPLKGDIFPWQLGGHIALG